jgi:NADPH:quinone reductase-like Zn-dependent oxidoreductase
MTAVRIEEFGGPEVLQTADIPVPVPGEDEVLIELRASGVNRTDVLTCGVGDATVQISKHLGAS